MAEINTGRKHRFTLNGGHLARRAEPARGMALLISDVVGDDPGTIASGPVTADASTFEDAWQVIERYDLAQRIPSAIRRRLEKGRLGQVPETPKPGRSEEHTSELQSLMRISYAVFCLKKKKQHLLIEVTYT